MTIRVINPYVFGVDTFLAAYYETRNIMASFDAQSGFNYTRLNLSGTLGLGVVYQGGVGNADDTDSVEWYIHVEAGTYTFTLAQQKSNNRAITDILIDGVSIGTIDGYNATSITTVTDITSVAISGGVHTLKLLANGKNASSSDYIMAPSYFGLVRTGA